MEQLLDELATYSWANLEDVMPFELDGVVEKEVKKAYCVENLKLCLACIDYTTLKPTDTESSVKAFVADLLKKLKKNDLRQVAAVCVYPNFASVVRNGLKGTEIRTAVVAGGFPASQTFTEIKLAECKMTVAEGAEEVDVVIAVGDVLEKNFEKIYRELSAIRKVCKGVRLKVILETGELKSIENIFNASLVSMYAGADFIKTSTGKVPVNVTPEAMYVMCEAVRQFYARTGKRVGLKVSGGVSKATNALRYLTIVNHVLGSEWLTSYYFRIGASQLFDDIVKEIKLIPSLPA
ncbi:MAG: deoxyribose-phosphate aldolase [Culturomica sp.]|jgi:deoxyribose-phosphate aldolase|nr:deoxyribose-phosphate aldolase [Culturomica sp.]